MSRHQGEPGASLVVYGGLIIFGTSSILIVGSLGFGFPGQGTYSGTVTQHQDGFMASSYTLKTNPEYGDSIELCASNEQVEKSLDQALQSDTEVTVEYSRGWFVPFWDCSSNKGYITEVEFP